MSLGVPNLPRKLRLETSTACQLRCPLCPTAQGKVAKHLGTGFLTSANFEKLLRANPYLEEVELSNYGEPLLNPQLADILRIACELKVDVSMGNGVNLNQADSGLLEALVRYRVKRITVALDGASQESYAKYRVRGDLARVLANIREINRLKKLYHLERPYLRWQFVVFGHNEHELPLARQLAGQLNMEFHPKKNWDASFSPLRDQEFVQREAGWPGTALGVNNCLDLWTAPQVNYDGKLLGCCVNFWGDFGPNVFEHGLEQTLQGPKMRHAREVLMGRAEPSDDLPCGNCSHYRALRRAGRWVRPEEVKISGGPAQAPARPLRLESPPS